jgi:hypothetical protein
MANLIEDGNGTGRKAFVGTSNRLLVHAVTEDEEIDSNARGDAYNINTGSITLTNAVDTPVLYLKNGEEKDLIVRAIAFGVKTSTGGDATDVPEATIIRNPTAGTIIDNANTVDINSNRNYGSPNTLASSIAYKGATGESMTDGVNHIFVYLPTSGRAVIVINEVLPKGTSMGIKIKPQTNNTSQTFYCAPIVYLHNEEL